MKNSHYKVGMLVDHPNRPQWGPGKIVHVEETKIHVFFRDSLERKAKPIVCAVVVLAIAASQTDTVLDELPAASEENGSWLLPARYGQQGAPHAAPKKKRSGSPPAPTAAV